MGQPGPQPVLRACALTPSALPVWCVPHPLRVGLLCRGWEASAQADPILFRAAAEGPVPGGLSEGLHGCWADMTVLEGRTQPASSCCTLTRRATWGWLELVGVGWEVVPAKGPTCTHGCLPAHAPGLGRSLPANSLFFQAMESILMTTGITGISK